MSIESESDPWSSNGVKEKWWRSVKFSHKIFYSKKSTSNLSSTHLISNREIHDESTKIPNTTLMVSVKESKIETVIRAFYIKFVFDRFTKLTVFSEWCIYGTRKLKFSSSYSVASCYSRLES